MKLKSRFAINPKNVYVEKSVIKSPLAKRVQRQFSSGKFHEIPSFKEYIRDKRFSPKNYNQRQDNLFIIRERFDFFGACPCSDKSVSCGYHIFNLGMGCPYECVYCHLQGYINTPGIVIPANIEDYFKDFEHYPRHVCLGSGQFTDSLAFDPITHYSEMIVDFLRDKPKTLFEFKTKSAQIDLLKELKAIPNAIVSWSMNPPRIIQSMEYYTASFLERLNAASQCAAKGYRIAFHFDPIIRYPNWEEDYRILVDKILTNVDAKQVAWISLGCLRMPTGLKKIIENRFPENPVLDEELVLDFDRKLRYPLRLRIDCYQKMLGWIRCHNKTAVVYLCMEEPSAYRACQLQVFQHAI